MADLVIVNQQTTLVDLLKQYEGELDEAQLREIVNTVRDANAHLFDDSILPIGVPILLPGAEPQMCMNPSIKSHLAQVAAAPLDQRQLLDEALGIVGGEQLAALAQMLADYGLYGAAGDTNTFGAASLGHAVSQASGFHNAVLKVDDALAAYAAAPTGRRHAAKQAVETAYRKLHADFRSELNHYVARQGRARTVRRHPLMNSTRGMNMARSGSRTLPLGTHPNLRPVQLLMQHGRVIGRGMIALDIGFRARNIWRVRRGGGNWHRTIAGEFGGLALSLAMGYAVGLLLGPFGLIIILLAVGATAVAFDHIGRSIGHTAYDSFASAY